MIPFPGAGVHQLVQRVRQGRGERGPGRGHDRHPDPPEGGRPGQDVQVGGPEGDQAQGGRGRDGEQEEKMLQRLKYFVLFHSIFTTFRTPGGGRKLLLFHSVKSCCLVMECICGHFMNKRSNTSLV